MSQVYNHRGEPKLSDQGVGTELRVDTTWQDSRSNQMELWYHSMAGSSQTMPSGITSLQDPVRSHFTLYANKTLPSFQLLFSKPMPQYWPLGTWDSKPIDCLVTRGGRIVCRALTLLQHLFLSRFMLWNRSSAYEEWALSYHPRKLGMGESALCY